MSRAVNPVKFKKRTVLRTRRTIIMGQSAPNAISRGRWMQPHFRTAAYKPGSS